MPDYDKCPECNRFWTTCPCCSESFCESCSMREDEVDWTQYESEEDE